MSDQTTFDLAETLKVARDEVLARGGLSSPEQSQSWEIAQKVVEEFDPVPWFVRRLSKIAFGKYGTTLSKVPEGAVLGFNKLLCAAASDIIVGTGEPVTDAKEAIGLLRGDVFAAVVVLHTISKRVQARNFQKSWFPILDQAIMRAQIGFCVGEKAEGFGSGRGMLAGFVSRIGLCILMCRGSVAEGNGAIELLMKNPNISEVGLKIYGCSPLHIGAFLLSVVGCGGNASLGFVSFSIGSDAIVAKSSEQSSWACALYLIEAVRNNELDQVADEVWEHMGFLDREERLALEDLAHTIKRRGHSWSWVL